LGHWCIAGRVVSCADHAGLRFYSKGLHFKRHRSVEAVGMSSSRYGVSNTRCMICIMHTCVGTYARTHVRTYPPSYVPTYLHTCIHHIHACVTFIGSSTVQWLHNGKMLIHQWVYWKHPLKSAAVERTNVDESKDILTTTPMKNERKVLQTKSWILRLTTL